MTINCLEYATGGSDFSELGLRQADMLLQQNEAVLLC